MTTFENKTIILSELWLNYRDDEGFRDFIEYNDLALPFAFAISEGLIATQESMVKFIEDAWEILLSTLNIDDADYSKLDDLLEQSFGGQE
jgi:hypothetical protein